MEKLRDDYARVVAQRDAAANGIALGKAPSLKAPAAAAAPPSPVAAAKAAKGDGDIDALELLTTGVAIYKTGRNGLRYNRLFRWASESDRLEWTDGVSGWRGVSTRGASALVRESSLTVATTEVRGCSSLECRLS